MKAGQTSLPWPWPTSSAPSRSISTTTEAVKDLIVGVGCRRGHGRRRDRRRRSGSVVAGRLRSVDQVRLLASADIKADEPGLGEAARQLGLPLRLIAAEEIRHTARAFEHSDFVQEKVDLPAVAEPARCWRERERGYYCPSKSCTA